MKRLMFVVMTTGALALYGTHDVAWAQQPQTAQQMFEAGQYDQALQAIDAKRADGALSPSDLFLASQVLLHMSPPAVDRAKAELSELAVQGDPGWGLVAQSARALADNNTAAALKAATEATTTSPDLFAAYYQLGLVKGTSEDWTGAAAAFERATELEPTFAYAHYYAGIAYSRIKRTDKEALHFDAFVKLAPKAPERLAVESIMRTLRGR
jgi:tetratricopeptide (TPR) repeat protein